MIIEDISYESFLIDSRIFRKGLLLNLTASNGKQATTEISPLPGFSRESLEDAKHQLAKIKRKIQSIWWTKESLGLLQEMDLFSSVYFGLETAILDLLEPIDPIITSYHLLLGTREEILDRAEELDETTPVKIKLGHFTPQLAHEIVSKLKRFKLRLDLNRKWRREKTIEFCSHYPDDFFEYIEEPCNHEKDLVDFPYPFALDETLRTPFSTSLLKEKNLRALILKPTLTYPLDHFLNLGVPCVVTSAFEGSVGIDQIKRLIARLGLDNTYHGLDTLETSSELRLGRVFGLFWPIFQSSSRGYIT